MKVCYLKDFFCKLHLVWKIFKSKIDLFGNLWNLLKKLQKKKLKKVVTKLKQSKPLVQLFWKSRFLPDSVSWELSKFIPKARVKLTFTGSSRFCIGIKLSKFMIGEICEFSNLSLTVHFESHGVITVHIFRR